MLQWIEQLNEMQERMDKLEKLIDKLDMEVGYLSSKLNPQPDYMLGVDYAKPGEDCTVVTELNIDTISNQLKHGNPAEYYWNNLDANGNPICS